MPSKESEFEGKYYPKGKLLDVRWLQKKIEVLKRDGERCQSVDEGGKQCERSSKRGDHLEIHHRNYTTTEPWDEPFENLITLCRDHHEAEKNTNLGQAAREVSNALMKSNWMVGQRKLLTRCISGKIVSPEEICCFIRERMK